MRLAKTLLIPAALAMTPAAALAAPTSPGGNVPEQVRTGIETTPAHYRGYYHDHYYYRPHWRRHYYYYGPRYYGPRCRWSHYWQRTVCR